MKWEYSFFAVLLTLSVCGAGKPVVPIIHAEQEEVQQTVEPSGSWKESSAAGYSNRSGTPAGVLASRLGTANNLIQWKPSQLSCMGGADLTDAVLSEDESLLIIAERIGGAGKNNSTRFIFVNLCNGKITGGFLLEKRRITRLAVIPGRPGTILGVQEAQSAFHSPDAVLEIDLMHGRVVREFPSSGAIASITASADAYWYTLKGSPTFVRQPCSGAAHTLRSRAVEPLVSASRDGKNIFVCGKGMAELYENSAQAPLLESWPLPEELNPEWSCAASEDGRLQVLGRSGGPVSLFNNGNLLPLVERSGSGCVFFAEKNCILLQHLLHGAMQFYSLPDGASQGRPANIGSLRPSTRNTTFRFFARSGEERNFVLIDHRGNVFQVRVSERMRWTKKLLLRTDSTGLQR